MADFIKPIVNAFLVFDTIIEDIITRKKSLIGIVTHLPGLTFPGHHRQL